MTLEDLQHIFDRQIEDGTEKLYFMLVDGDRMPVVQPAQKKLSKNGSRLKNE
jgi:hypothetical protein